MSVKGKVIVITGAASGLGRETARVFASKGAKLSLADIQEKPLKDFEAELKQAGAEVISQVVDVRKREDVNSWIAATVAKFGNLDGAANMASVLGPPRSMAKIEDTKDEDWDFVMGINVTGLRNCLQAQIPHFNTGGSIVNIASITGLKGAESQSAYSTSKHAVVGMTRSIAKELGPRNIRANCICP
jgi:NAD(P)-dependent dehydrogenase (short-subunit alcohol dehydrogenase family)